MSQRVAQPCPCRDQKVSSYPMTGLRQCPSSRVCVCLRPRRAVRASRHPLNQEAQRPHSLSVLPSWPSQRRRSDRLPPLRSLSRFPSTQRRFPSGQRPPLAPAVRPSQRHSRILLGPSQSSARASASVGRSVSRNTSTRCCATLPSSSARTSTALSCPSSKRSGIVEWRRKGGGRNRTTRIFRESGPMELLHRR